MSSPRTIRRTTTGHDLSQASYLDSRFEAARPEYEAMLRWVGINQRWRVLDAGSGSGSYLPLLCELVGPVGAVMELDLAPENIAACKSRIDDLRPECRVETRIGSVLDLPLEDGSFDAVWSANTSEYLRDDELETMLAELRRVTRPCGIIALKDSDATCLQIAGIQPGAMWRFLETARLANRQLAGVLRAINLPQRLRRAGLTSIRAQMVPLARFAPLMPVEMTAWGTLVEFVAGTALDSDLPEEDLVQWRDLMHRLKHERLLEQPDFFIREGAIVVVGETPRG